MFHDLSKPEELHVIRTPNRYRMPNALRVDALNTRSIDGPGITALGIIGLCALGLAVIITEDTSPLLHRLLVVGRAQRRV